MHRIEEYKSLDDIQHVLTRPGMYISSTKRVPRPSWCLDLSGEVPRPFVSTISTPEGLERIALEIFSNASDNTIESYKQGYEASAMYITMDETTVSVTNGGLSIPTGIHPEAKIHNPQMIFGVMKSGSKYTEGKHGIGQNGIGSKAANIMSTRFTVDIWNSIEQVHYSQVWENNMMVCHPPQIEPYDGANGNITTITFTPDFPRFEMQSFDAEAYALFARHALDLSFTCKIPVVFNGITFNYFNVLDYSKLYFPSINKSNSLCLVYHQGKYIDPVSYNQAVSQGTGLQPEVEICLIDTPDKPQVLSFVNCMMTFDGGVHVDALGKTVSGPILELVQGPKKPKSKDTPKVEGKKDAPKLNFRNVLNHMSIILNVQLVDPDFTSQSKTKLKSPTPKFNISPELLQPISKWAIVKRLELDLKAKKTIASDMKNRRENISSEKLEDANFVKHDPLNCSLFVVEGNSAKTYAIACMKYIPNGRDYFGVYTLRGKPLNVMNASDEKLERNIEWGEFKAAIGARSDVNYLEEGSEKGLRYGKVIILTDADNDGKHITGLIINYFMCLFPTLVQRQYIMLMRTPILRAHIRTSTYKFYSIASYQDWLANTKGAENAKVKYFKGLGTSEKNHIADDMKEPRMVSFIYDDTTAEKVHMVFSDKESKKRKDWISARNETTSLGIEEYDMLGISQFIDYEFINFAVVNMVRSIPMGLDGLKTSQRQIIYACFMMWGSKNKPLGYLQKNEKMKEVKVEQLGPFVASKVDYHYGEDNLKHTIIRMAQDFPGANNMPLLQPKGGFGTRIELGDDAASPRYIFTQPSELLRFIFVPDDFPLLPRRKEEDKDIEPPFLLPIVPLALINGAKGIGSAWSTFIPNYNPLHIIDRLKRRLMGDPNLPPLRPWYRGFRGTVSVVNRDFKPKKFELSMMKDEIRPLEEVAAEFYSKNRREVDDDYVGGDDDKLSMLTEGKFKETSNGVRITEVPIGRSFEWYKAFLDSLKREKKIGGYNIYGGDEHCDWLVYGLTFSPTMKSLSLVKAYGLSNMTLLNRHEKPICYPSPERFFEVWYKERLSFYPLRKQSLIDRKQKEIDDTNDMLKFIKAVVEGRIVLFVNNKGRRRADVEKDMVALGLRTSLFQDVRAYHFTEEEIAKLERELVKLTAEMQTIVETTPEQFWLNDLEMFEAAYKRLYKE